MPVPHRNRAGQPHEGRVRIRGPRGRRSGPEAACGLGAGQAKIAVRPQSFVLSASSNATGLEGRIVKSAYLGSHMEYTVSTAGSERFAIDRNVQTPFAAGTIVHVSFADHGVSLVPGTVRDQYEVPRDP